MRKKRKDGAHLTQGRIEMQCNVRDDEERECEEEEETMDMKRKRGCERYYI